MQNLRCHSARLFLRQLTPGLPCNLKDRPHFFLLFFRLFRKRLDGIRRNKVSVALFFRLLVRFYPDCIGNVKLSGLCNHAELPLLSLLRPRSPRASNAQKMRAALLWKLACSSVIRLVEA